MRAGAVVALVSDAGMPLVSDPGYVLVRGCVAAGLEIEVLPGPSAVPVSLAVSLMRYLRCRAPLVLGAVALTTPYGSAWVRVSFASSLHPVGAEILASRSRLTR
jgi:CBS-domain-containing membrane protein